MAHKCFVSFKKEDRYYLNQLLDLFHRKNVDVIERSLDRVIDSNDGEYVMKVIRDDFLKDSTVTIFLIGKHSSEKEGNDYLDRPHNYFIQRELQASLYNGEGNTRNGILGLVLPEMYSEIYRGEYTCNKCWGIHNFVKIDDDTVIREFGENYYIKADNKCCWNYDERYCVLVKWDDFIENPEKYIDMAFEKRNSEIAKKVKVRNFR